MIRGQHGPYVRVERHPDGGCIINRKAAVIIASSFFIVLSLLFLSIYFVSDLRFQLRQSVLEQESLIQASNLQEEEKVNLQNKLDGAEYMVSDMRLELNALLKNSFSDLVEGSLDPWETFLGFMWSVNTGEYDVAYSLTNYSYQSACSSDDFIIAVKSSGVKFPLTKLLGLAAESNLKIAVIFYTTLSPDTDDGFLRFKIIPEEGGRFVFPVPSSFCGDLSSQDSVPPITAFQ